MTVNSTLPLAVVNYDCQTHAPALVLAIDHSQSLDYILWNSLPLNFVIRQYFPRTLSPSAKTHLFWTESGAYSDFSFWRALLMFLLTYLLTYLLTTVWRCQKWHCLNVFNAVLRLEASNATKCILDIPPHLFSCSYCTSQTPIHDVDDLKHRLIDAWSGVQQSIIDEVIDQWCKRLTACLKANWRHFEHLLRLSECLTSVFKFYLHSDLSVNWYC